MSERKVCEICECFDDEHDYEHFSRVCYPLEIAKLRTKRDELVALLKELIDIEGPQPGTAEWARKVQAAIAKAEGT